MVKRNLDIPAKKTLYLMWGDLIQLGLASTHFTLSNFTTLNGSINNPYVLYLRSQLSSAPLASFQFSNKPSTIHPKGRK